MNFSTVCTFSKVIVFLLLLSHNILIPFFPLYLKYLNFSLLQMGFIRALMMWIPMLLTPLSIVVVKKVSNLSRRVCISASIFTTLTMCICFTFVAPIENPHSVTPCKKEISQGSHIKLNSSTITTTQNLNVHKLGENQTIQLSGYLQNLVGLAEAPLTLDNKGFFVGSQQVNETSIFKETSTSSPLQDFQKINKYKEKQSQNHSNRGKKFFFKEKKLKQNRRLVTERVNLRKTPFTNSENKLKGGPKVTVIPETMSAHYFVENQRNYENLGALASLQRDSSSQSIDDYYQNTQHNIMPSVNGAESDVDINILGNNNFQEEALQGRQIKHKERSEVLRKKSIVMPMENKEDYDENDLKKRELGKLQENKYDYPSTQGDIFQSTDNMSLPRLYDFQVIRTKNQFGSETFFTVMILAIIYEVLFSFFTPWADILCYDNIEKYTYEHLLITQIFMFKSPVLLVSYPVVSILVALLPCPYQLAMHTFAGAIVLLIAFLSALLFLCLQYPDITHFRSRKPSKPPMEEHLEQNSVLKFFKTVTCMLLGFCIASQVEYILWKADTLMGFPFNYEYLYCGYFTFNIFSYILIDKYLQYRREKDNTNIEEEDSEEEESVVHFSYEWFMNTKEIIYTERQRSNFNIILGTFFLSLTLLITSLIKEPWYLFLVALLKGASDAFIESAVPQGNWMLVIFGYGVGCLIGSFISSSIGINFIFYISSGIMLLCFLGWLIHSLLYWAHFGPRNFDKSRNQKHYRYFSI